MKSTNFFEREGVSVGGWTNEPSKICFETVGSMCSSS